MACWFGGEPMKEQLLKMIYRQFAIEQMAKHLKADNDLYVDSIIMYLNFSIVMETNRNPY